jgi:hypothetical protein
MGEDRPKDGLEAVAFGSSASKSADRAVCNQVTNHMTTHVSLVSCVPARLDDLPGRRTAVAGLACRLPVSRSLVSESVSRYCCQHGPRSTPDAISP